MGRAAPPASSRSAPYFNNSHGVSGCKLQAFPSSVSMCTSSLKLGSTRTSSLSKVAPQHPSHPQAHVVPRSSPRKRPRPPDSCERVAKRESRRPSSRRIPPAPSTCSRVCPGCSPRIARECRTQGKWNRCRPVPPGSDCDTDPGCAGSKSPGSAARSTSPSLAPHTARPDKAT
jgi:hypothetical protein